MPSSPKRRSLSLHDALPIWTRGRRGADDRAVLALDLPRQRADRRDRAAALRSEEHTSELQSLRHIVCRLPLNAALFPYTTLFRSGPVVGGALTTGLSWRWIFLVNVPIGVIALLLCLFRVEESRQPGAHRPDVIGAVTFSGALGALVYALIKGDRTGWGSTLILACLIGAAALLVAFVTAEAIQGERAMFDLKLDR